MDVWRRCRGEAEAIERFERDVGMAAGRACEPDRRRVSVPLQRDTVSSSSDRYVIVTMNRTQNEFDTCRFSEARHSFYDITTLMQDAAGFRAAIDNSAAVYRTGHRSSSASSRGYLQRRRREPRRQPRRRKPGKLPSTTVKANRLEYGTDCLEMHLDGVKKGQRVLIVDDLLATGGTAAAAAGLVKGCGGEVAALAFLIELVALNGRAKLGSDRVHAVLQY